MKSLLFVLSQLILVTLVYAFAYRAGYRSAQSKAISVVRKFADPVTCLLDQLRESVDEAEKDERPTRRRRANPPEADPPRADRTLQGRTSPPEADKPSRGGQASNV